MFSQYDSVSISRLPSWYSSVWPATHLFIWLTTASSSLMPVLADDAQPTRRSTLSVARTTSATGALQRPDHVRMWNTLPLNLRLCDSLGQFKRSLKTFLFGLWDHGALWLTHSLTAALDQLRVVASSTSNDPGPRSRQHQQIGRLVTLALKRAA